MKQNITASQLDELSVEAREKLHKYLKIETESGLDWPAKYYQTVLLTIGEMIEFLSEKAMGGYDLKIIINEVGCSIWKCIGNLQDNTLSKLNTSEDGVPELCDALWEAVKEILEKKEKYEST